MDLSERGASVSRHPWELARARFFSALIDEHLDGVVPRRVLDVGAGDGWFAGELVRFLDEGVEIVCWDINYSSQELAADLPAGVRRTATAPHGTFDLVLVMDVLEHVLDDGRFLDEDVVPRLAHGGALVVSVPAYQWLFSAHDVALSHYRRYSPRQLRRVLEDRFHVVSQGGLFATLVPLRLVSRVRERVAGPRPQVGVGNWDGNERLTRWLTAVLTADAQLGRWFANRGRVLPGLSSWAVCRLPGDRPA